MDVSCLVAGSQLWFSCSRAKESINHQISLVFGDSFWSLGPKTGRDGIIFYGVNLTIMRHWGCATVPVGEALTKSSAFRLVFLAHATGCLCNHCRRFAKLATLVHAMAWPGSMVQGNIRAIRTRRRGYFFRFRSERTCSRVRENRIAGLWVGLYLFAVATTTLVASLQAIPSLET